MKSKRSYNVQIWVGLREGYTNKHHTIQEVRRICDNWVNSVEDCVSITPTEFRYVDGFEKGVVIGYIKYPRFPRTKKKIRKRAIVLGKLLMVELNQFRVSITTPSKTYLLENRKIKAG